MNTTAEIIKHNRDDAKEAAQGLIDFYKKDFDKVYVEAEHTLKDFLSPLISWFTTVSDENSNATSKKNKTLALIQHTLDKGINGSRVKN